MAVTETFTVGDEVLSRVLDAEEGAVRTTRLVLGADEYPVESRELALVLDASTWRHDIPGWRFTRSDGSGERRGFQRPELDDSRWVATSHLHPLYDVVYDGHAWFRARIELPEAEAGEPLSVVLGGLDDEDWLSYRLFVNGVLVDEWRPEGIWRDPYRLKLEPGDPRYELLAFGASNVLAVETQGLDRRRPWMRPGEDEHYFFQGWLIDQFVAVGEPYGVLSDFRVTDTRELRNAVEVDVESRERPGVCGTLRYEEGQYGVLRKRVTLANGSDGALELLDVVLEDLTLPFEVSRGGSGWPILGGRLFLGLEHPAGLNQGDGDRVRVSQLPGLRIEPGGSFSSEPAAIGASPPGVPLEQAFRDYVTGLRPRRRRRLAIYSALGWYDFTNPADPLFELDAGLVEENLGQLDELAEAGAHFDAYMFDDWWEPSDPESFRQRTFPAGGAAAGALVREHGLTPGLWTAPVSTGWGWEQTPGIDAALAGGVDPAYVRPADPETGKWSWDEVFGQAFTCAPRFCLAAEPLRSLFPRAMGRHALDLRLGCLKLDGPILHCTSSEHGHRPGRHSLDAAARTLLDGVRAAEEASPGLVTVWYWGARSPWWLKYGDVLFDKGLKLEAASPASTPAFSLRQAISLNTDQAVRHAAHVPLPLQDSLGVWIGNVAWANRIGKEGWRDAFLLDVARGSVLLQLWGDLTLLDADDREFLARVLRWVRSTDDGYETTAPIGGDPWLAEPYGYARRAAGGAIVTAYNPRFEAAVLALDLAPLGMNGARVHEAYPFPGTIGPAERMLEVTLNPFEVRCIELLAGSEREQTSERPLVRATRPLDLSALRVERTDEWSAQGVVPLPSVERGDWVVLAGRLARDGVSWYHPEPHELISFAARMRGAEVFREAVPWTSSQNGPGYPWVVFRMPAGRSWSHQELRLTLRARLPADATLELEGWVLEPWWLTRKTGFESALRPVISAS